MPAGGALENTANMYEPVSNITSRGCGAVPVCVCGRGGGGGVAGGRERER
jgi:hypothetical protein